MSVRLDYLNGLVPDAYTYMWEGKDLLYKTYNPIYPKLAIIKDTSQIKGGFEKSTNVIGADEMGDQINYGTAEEDKPIESFPVYWTIKTKSKKFKVPREVMRDMKHRAENWLKSYAKDVVPRMIETTKERIVAAPYKFGGYTSGNAIFNQDDADVNLATGYTDFIYDGKPLFALTGNNHTAKNAATYYNALAVTSSSASGQSNGVNFANAITMWNLLTFTNAKMENGQEFDNGQDVCILTSKPSAPDWDVIQNSTLNPDNNNNASNPLKGMFKEVIGSPYITTAAQSVMFRKEGMCAYFGKPQMMFYELYDPEETWLKVYMDYAIAPRNFRPFVSNNAPTS